MKTKTQISTLHKLKSLALVGVLTAVGAVTAHAVNVINNGDFTANASLFTDTTPNGWTGLTSNPGVPSSNPEVIPGWDLQYNVNGWCYYGINGPLTSVTYQNYWGPADPGGLTYMAFYPGAAGLASQALSLTANTSYTLSYQVASSQWNPGAVTYGVTIADGAATYYTTSAVANSAAFDTITATFTTPGTITGTPVISLADVAGPYSSAVAFANVSLEAVPEPTTMALAGLGLAGLLIFRRRTA